MKYIDLVLFFSCSTPRITQHVTSIMDRVGTIGTIDSSFLFSMKKEESQRGQHVN